MNTIHKKLAFIITLIISFNYAIMYGMNKCDGETNEFINALKKLPKDIQEKEIHYQLARLKLQDAVIFLSMQQPLTSYEEVPHNVNNSFPFLKINSNQTNNKRAIGLYDNRTLSWDINNNEIVRTKEPCKSSERKDYDYHTEHHNIILSAAMQNNMIITGSKDETAKLWHIEEDGYLTLMDTLTAEKSTNCAHAISAVAIDGNKILTGSYDCSIKLWHIEEDDTCTLITTTPTCKYGGHGGKIKSIAIQGNIVITGSEERTAKLWNIRNNQFKLLDTTTRNDHYGHSSSIDFVAIQNNIVLTKSSDDIAKLWNIENNTFNLIATINTTAIAIHNNLVITGSIEGIQIWDIDNQRRLIAISDPINPYSSITSIAIQDDMVITGSSNATLRLWSLWPNITDKPEDNPLIWMLTMPNVPVDMQIIQANFINRAYQATLAKIAFIIALPEKLGIFKDNESPEQQDGRIYFTFPQHVRHYLRKRLDIKPLTDPFYKLII